MNGEHKIGDGASVRPMLKEQDFRALLGGISERRFKELLAAGVIGRPLELGPRTARWTYQDYLDTVARLPRREALSEPETIAAGRRARIERMKAEAGA